MPTYNNLHKLLIILLMGICGLHMTSCRENENLVKISFIVNTTTLEQGEKVYISGNHKSLGYWNPDLIELVHKEKNHWKFSDYFTIGEILEYKFTKGSWENEASDSLGRPLLNNVLKVEKDTTVKAEIVFWKNGDQITIEGQITGKVEYYRNVSGPGIEGRDVIVWLPPMYDTNPAQRYPVLYMHDGQNIIDPKTSAFKVDWQLDETADSLVRQNIIEPIIIVGIYNTQNRTQEYSPGEMGSAYMNFVVNILKPMIDESFRTQPGRKHTITGGSSMGGLISFMLAWEYSEVFSGAICMSPAFKIQQFDYVNAVADFNDYKKDIRIYIDNGGVGLEEELQPGIDQMIRALESKGFIGDQDYFWIKDADARHSEVYWGSRIGPALKIFFEK